jgi:hypothetical protein
LFARRKTKKFSPDVKRKFFRHMKKSRYKRYGKL